MELLTYLVFIYIAKLLSLIIIHLNFTNHQLFIKSFKDFLIFKLINNPIFILKKIIPDKND